MGESIELINQGDSCDQYAQRTDRSDHDQGDHLSDPTDRILLRIWTSVVT
jgi:hypothetical protein